MFKVLTGLKRDYVLLEMCRVAGEGKTVNKRQRVCLTGFLTSFEKFQL